MDSQCAAGATGAGAARRLGPGRRSGSAPVVLERRVEGGPAACPPLSDGLPFTWTTPPSKDRFRFRSVPYLLPQSIRPAGQSAGRGAPRSLKGWGVHTAKAAPRMHVMASVFVPERRLTAARQRGFNDLARWPLFLRDMAIVIGVIGLYFLVRGVAPDRV